MPRQTAVLLAFNRGIVSRYALARVDVKRVAMSGELMVNFIPRTLGPMSIRPGWKYLGGIQGHNPAKLIPFVFAVDDTHIIEITSAVMRIWRNDELIERTTVGTGITNGTFGTDLTGWTDSDEAGATSSWRTGGYMQLLGDGTNAAIREQQVTVAGGDAGDEHVLRVTVTLGPVLLRVGSTAGAEDYIRELSLGTGIHSLAFEPAGNFYIRLFSRASYPVLVDSVAIESSGILTIPVPWGEDDLDLLRWDQSGDIVFVACEGHRPRMIKRWAINSWSIENYEPIDGPFRTENVTEITIGSSAITGEVTLTASKSIFKSTHVGALFSLTSEGQDVTENISAQNTFTDPIRVTGVDSSRVFTIILSGTWSATVTLQRSLESEDGTWEDVSGMTWSGNTTETFDDGLDNQIAWYRIGVKTGQYTSGTVVASLTYALGSITGVVEIITYSSGTSVTAVVLRDLGGTEDTTVWAEGAWSDFRGYPSAVALHEGRLWWAGKDKIWGSITDALDSFDPDFEGDAGPISRSLGVGPTDRVNWLFSSQRLLIGADLNEYAARSSSLDEPLTPTQFTVKATGDQGTAAVVPGSIDREPAFVNRTGMKVFRNEMKGEKFDYGSADLCALVPEIGDPEIVRLAVQRQPDTRIHAVRSDGTVALCVLDKAEDVIGWCEVESETLAGQSYVEDAVVLPAQPGVQDDYVYYVVRREIDGEEVRYLEKWAQAQNTRGGVGLAGDENPYKAFSGFEVSMTDYVGAIPFLFWYDATNDQFIVLGEAQQDLFLHNVEPFAVPGTNLNVVSYINGGSRSGVITKEGRYIVLTGQDTNNANISIQIYDTQTGTTLAVGPSGPPIDDFLNQVMAAREGPPFEIIVARAGADDIRMYRPNTTTGAFGAAIWTVSNSAMVNGGFPWTWGDPDTDDVWVIGNRDGARQSLFQWNALTGTTATHIVPALPFSGDVGGISGMVAYDHNNRKIYAVLIQSGGVHPEYLYEYSGWATTPTSDSGTWTLLDTYTTSNAYLGNYIYYDPNDDVLFSLQITSALGSQATVRRYVGNPKVLVDETFSVSSDDGNVDIFGYAAQGLNVFYKDGAGYIGAQSGGVGQQYLLKIIFDGAELLEDSEGNPLIPGGATGRLHDLADSYVNYDTAGPTVTGLDHLEGESVVVWANGVDLGTDDNYEQTYVVTAGALDPALDAEYSAVTIGLPYIAQFKSSKLAVATQMELLFGHGKRISEISFVLADTHAKGIRFGPDFDNLDDRPLRESWADIDPDEITEAYDEDTIMFQSEWATDLRVCLQAQAPRPCTVMAVKLIVET